MARTADDGGTGLEWVQNAMHPRARNQQAESQCTVESVFPTVYIFHDLTPEVKTPLGRILGFDVFP